MADTLNFKKGDVICEQGKYELWFYEVLSGSMTAYKDYGTDDQKELGKINGGYVGEMGFLNSMSRNSTVIADEDSSLVKIDEGSFNDYFISHPDKILSILQCLSGRLNEIDVNCAEAFNTLRDCVEANEKKIGISGNLKAAMRKVLDVFRDRSY